MCLNHTQKIAIILSVLQIACLTSASASAVVLTAVPDDATEYNFATVKAGLVQPTSLGNNAGVNTGNTTYTAGALVGRKFMDIFAVDLEYMYRGDSTSDASGATTPQNSNSNSWSMKSNIFMLSGSVDLVKDPKFRPYVRAGAGMSINSSGDYISSGANAGKAYTYTYAGKSMNSFAWQAGLGVNFKTTSILSTQLEYMFVDRGKVTTQANYTGGTTGNVVNAAAVTGKIKDHVVTIGLGVRF